MLTSVTDMMELVFINGGLKEDDDKDKTVGDILKALDEKLTMPKFTEYQVNHREAAGVSTEAQTSCFLNYFELFRKRQFLNLAQKLTFRRFRRRLKPSRLAMSRRKKKMK